MNAARDANRTPSGVLMHCGSVEVCGASSVRDLHAWARGGYGELVHHANDDAVGLHPTVSSQSSAVCTLLLSTVEAFHLVSTLPEPRLQIIHLSQPDESGDSQRKVLSPGECWSTFCDANQLFPFVYAAYGALRKAGWHIRNGIKFGADFTLYAPRAGPCAHALHSVIVVSPAAVGQRNWLWLQRHVRLCHTVGKGLLLCSVNFNRMAQDGISTNTPRCLNDLKVQTVRIGSWGAGREHGVLSS